MNYPPNLTQDELKRFVDFQNKLVTVHKVADSEKELVLPSIRGLSNDDLVDILEWYSDRVKLFYPAEPLFDDHTCLEPSTEAYYLQADRDTAYSILTDSKRRDAIVLQAESPSWQWFCIGIFSSKATETLLQDKFTKYDAFESSWQEEPSEFSGDSELSDYWNLYDNQEDQDGDEEDDDATFDTVKASELPLGELDIRIHREVHALWALYDGCGMSYTAFVSDLTLALGDSCLSKSTTDSALHNYMIVSVPNFLRTLESFGFSQKSLLGAVLDCLKSINTAETSHLLPNGFCQ